MVLILRDVNGIPDRAETLRRTFPGTVDVVCPGDLEIPGAVPVDIQEGWLPNLDAPRRWREWFAADALGFAAVQALAIDSDFVWFVESDVWAPDDIWRAVFAATATSKADAIIAKIIARDHSFAGLAGCFRWKGNPPWVTHSHFLALYRLSRRAIAWCIEEIEPLRDCFCECRVASVIHRRGGSVRDLREFVAYSAPRSFGCSVAGQRFDPRAMNHPVKHVVEA